MRAGAAALAGDEATAVERLRWAVEGSEAAEMNLYAAVARRRLGACLGGDEGAGLIAEADGWMERQRIKNPARMTATLAPGFPDP